MGRTLYVGGVRIGTRSQDLAKVFERYGPLVRCDIPNPASRDGMPSKLGYAFVEYESDDDAETAREALDKYHFDGYDLAVHYAKNTPRSTWRQDGPPRRNDDDGRSSARRDDDKYSSGGGRRDYGDDKYARRDSNRDDDRHGSSYRDEQQQPTASSSKPRDYRASGGDERGRYDDEKPRDSRDSYRRDTYRDNDNNRDSKNDYGKRDYRNDSDRNDSRNAPREDNYKRGDYKRDDYKRDDYKRDDYKRDDSKRDEYKREDYSRSDAKKDDYKRDDYTRKSEYKRDNDRKEYRDEPKRSYRDDGAAPRDSYRQTSRRNSREDTKRDERSPVDTKRDYRRPEQPSSSSYVKRDSRGDDRAGDSRSGRDSANYGRRDRSPVADRPRRSVDRTNDAHPAEAAAAAAGGGWEKEEDVVSPGNAWAADRNMKPPVKRTRDVESPSLAEEDVVSLHDDAEETAHREPSRRSTRQSKRAVSPVKVDDDSPADEVSRRVKRTK